MKEKISWRDQYRRFRFVIFFELGCGLVLGIVAFLYGENFLYGLIYGLSILPAGVVLVLIVRFLAFMLHGFKDKKEPVGNCVYVDHDGRIYETW